ncbi:MAG: winged helix-turn-helix transcriptional regulator, partial [Oscillospiraceae bacterium]|nr:winged helix-turn-helix transcriptional regulator [Oscillospiraceae bacterium]
MKKKTVLKIREFNRFYMPMLNLLGNHYLGSEYSAAEARVFFEIYENDGCTAAHIAKKMNIDKSYLSRIIKSHEKNGYIAKSVSAKDSRAFELHLTEKGLKRTEDFIEKSNRQVSEIIEPFNAEDCIRLTEALSAVTEILGKCSSSN